MSPNRREFLWTMGTAAGAMALLPLEQVFWSPERPPDLGWSPGIEERIRSACLLCPSRCGITGRVVDGRLVRITGNPLHPMSRGGICPRGVAGVQMLYHPERIGSPLVRSGARGAGSWRPLSHDDALTRLAELLQGIRQEGKPEGLAVLAGYAAGTMDDLWRHFLRAFGSPNYVSDAYADGTDAVMRAMHGIARAPSYDLAGSDMVISFGAPLFESWWSPVQAYAAFARPGLNGSAARTFVQVDHRFSRTAAFADDWVGVKPGTHAVLALGLAYVILRDRLFDEAFVRAHVSGFEDFRDARGRRRPGYRSLVLQRYRTEEVSAVTGVSVERITDLARSLASSERPVAVVGSDVTMAPDGLPAAMAVHSLNVILGSVNCPGGVLIGEDPPLAPLPATRLDAVARTGLRSPPIIAEAPPLGRGDAAMRFAEAVTSGGPAPEILLIHGANPLVGSPRSDLWLEALEKIPHVVSFSPFMDETTRGADLVIPDLLPWERWQDAPSPPSYPYPAWALSQPLVTPAEAGRHTGDVLLDLARRLGGSVAGSLPFQTFEEILQKRARGLFEAERGTVFTTSFDLENERKQEERGWWLGQSKNPDEFWSRLVERGGWVDPFYDYMDPDHLARTRSGRVELLPVTVTRALEANGGDLHLYGHGADGEGRDEAYPLRLLPYRVSTLASDTIGLERWMAEQPTVFPDTQWIPWITISPGTAAALDLPENILVSVVSRRGRYRARLKISPGTAPLTVCAPVGLRHPDGEAADPLSILDPETDPLTGVPAWHTTFVRLERV